MVSGHYPNEGQSTGQREGSARDYSHDAQRKEAPDENKPTKAQTGTVDSRKHLAKTADSPSAASHENRGRDIKDNGEMAKKSVEIPTKILAKNLWIPAGVGAAGFAGTHMLLRSMPPGTRLGLASAGGVFAAYLAAKSF